MGAGKELQDKLEAKLRAFEASSGAQEAAIAGLPSGTRAFCIAKGRLYFAIKDIINAARELHTKNPEAAAAYNLRVLYRKGASKEKAEPTPVAPTTKN